MRWPWAGVLLVLVMLALPSRAWALRCGTHIVKQGDPAPLVRERCGDPFFVDDYASSPGVGVTTPLQPGAVVTTEAWYYNFGPQRLMVRLDFSGGVLAREQTLGYGFAGDGGPCDFNKVTVGMSVASLIARCGLAPHRSRNTLAMAAYLGPRAPAWSEQWFYPAAGSRPALEVRLRDGRVTDVAIRH